MIVEGEFTRAELKRAEADATSVQFRLDQLREELARVRATAAAGEARAHAKKIGAALEDPEFRAACRALDLADENQKAAGAALRRCRRRRDGSWTETGLARQNEVAQANRVVEEIGETFRDLASGYGVSDQDCRWVSSRVRGFKQALKRLIDSYRDRDLPDLITEAVVEVDERTARVGLMQSHLVPPKTLGAFARYATQGQRRLLCRSIFEGYRPQFKTIQKDPDLRALADLGLIAVRGRSADPTPLGEDVARWITDSMPGMVAEAFVPEVPLGEVREAFDQEQLVTLIENGRRALEELGPGVDPTETVELGLPGVASCRIFRTVHAIQRFLRVLGSKPLRKKGGPRILRRKRPTFVPGKILDPAGVEKKGALCQS